MRPFTNEYDQLATPSDAMREYAMNVGGYDRFKNNQWILTDYDVWVKNPYYRGPDQPHPEDGYDYSDCITGEE